MRIGFIGIGNIAAAVVEGLCTAGREDLRIFLSPRNEEISRGLAEKYPMVSRMSSNQEVVDAAEIVCIAVRPAIAREVLEALRFRQQHKVVSFIPFLPFDTLSALVKSAGNVSRAIPLPSVAQHRCPIPLYRADEQVTRLFSLIGQPLAVDQEQQLHALWTLTGLIAPFYDLCQQLSEWTQSHGVAERTANTYIADMYGALSFMAQQSGPIDFRELASHAATPGGMNEQAGRQIREGGGHLLYTAAADKLLERFA